MANESRTDSVTDEVSPGANESSIGAVEDSVDKIAELEAAVSEGLVAMAEHLEAYRARCESVDARMDSMRPAPHEESVAAAIAAETPKNKKTEERREPEKPRRHFSRIM